VKFGRLNWVAFFILKIFLLTYCVVLFSFVSLPYYLQNEQNTMKKAKIQFLAGTWVLFEDSEEAPIIAAGSAMYIVQQANFGKISIVNRTTFTPDYQEELWDSIEGYLVRNDFHFVDIDNGTKTYCKWGFSIDIYENTDKEGSSIVLLAPNGEITKIPNDFYTLVGLLCVNNLDK
jgi:hypothetical protein